MLLSCVAIVAITVMLYFWRSRHVLLTVSLSMILGGGIGNMIDRILRGYVVDFFSFVLIDFPVFNVADIFITVSTALLAVLFLFVYQEEELQFLSRKKQETQ